MTAQIESGSRLGPYEILEPIGAGGMGEVFRARDTRLERLVAIKVLPAAFAQNEQFRARFEREAKNISQLNHPNICTLHDVGYDNGTSYLVMELLEGESLADRLSRGPLPIVDVLRYGTQIAAALDRAHRAGIIHRDLKPGNVMVTKSGAKLLDFGLAKSSASSAVSLDGATEHRPLTQEGTILGTFQYMAPEQLEGQEADARTDIFAFGALLYEMTTGRRAFEGKTKTSLIAAIVDRDPTPVSQLQALTPPALEHVIAKSLCKDADDRWQSAHDIAEELKWIGEAGSQAGVATPLTARRKNRERLTWVIALLALAGFATTALLLMRAKKPAAVYSFTVPRADGPYSFAGPALVSPNGSLLGFTARTGDDKPYHLFIRSLASFDVRALEGTEDSGSWEWSTDSRSITFVSGGKVKVVDVDGGAARSVADGKDVAGMAMNGNGVILIGSGVAGLRRVSAKNGATEIITIPNKARHEIAHTFPTFLPDGKHFLFTSFVRDPSRSEQPHYLYAGSLDSKEIKLLGEISSQVAYVDPGNLVFVRDGTLMEVGFDASSLEIKGDPQPIVDGVSYFKPLGYADFSASRNGVLTYRGVVGAQSLAWVDRAGRRMEPVGPTAQINDFRIAPDGLTVAAVIVDRKIGTGDLWIYSTKREAATRLTVDPGYEASPVFTPDGNRLLYASDRLGVPDIFMKQIGSAEADRPIVVAPGEQNPHDVSPDGRFLLYESDEYSGTQSDLFIVPLDGSAHPAPFVKTPFQDGQGRFSPDGKWIAYQTDESGSFQIYVKPFPGPGQAHQISTKGGSQPRWSPDGKTLYFRFYNRLFAADVTKPESEPQLLFESQQRFGAFEVARDGDRFLMSLNDAVAAQTPTRIIVNWPELLRQRAAKRNSESHPE